MPKPFLLRLDLQKFSDDPGGGAFGGYDPSTAYEGIEVEGVQPEGQGEFDEYQQEDYEQEEFQEEFQQPEEQYLDFGGRVLPASEELAGLHQDFTEQQRYITSLQEQVKAFQQITQMQQQMQPQMQQEPEQEISMNTQEWTEETWQQFYDNPQDVIGSLVQNAIEQYASQTIEPIIQERQWNEEIQNMYNNYPDFDQYIGEVQTLLDQFPERYADRQGGLEEAYFRVKATQAASMNPASLAQDPQFLQQYVFSNPQVQQQIVGQYMQQKQQVNQRVPVQMRGAGGFTPQTPDAQPKTLKEASRLFLKQRGLNY